MLNIKTASTNLPPRIVFAGVEGIGKTSFGAEFPSPLFLMSKSETGLLTLMDSGQVDDVQYLDAIQSWHEFADILTQIIRSELVCKTLVLDTISGFERLYYQHVLDSEFGGSAEKFTAYGKDKAYPYREWQMFLQALDTIRTKGISILAISHVTIAPFKNPEGPDYDRYVPRMIPAVWQLTFAWSDIVIFANHETFTKRESDMPGIKFKGISAGRRYMHTQRTAAYDAKSRYRLPPVIDMGSSSKESYDNFIREFIENKKNIDKVVVNGSSKTSSNNERSVQ